MSQEDIKKIINKYLEQSGCKNVLFEELNDNSVIVLFDSEEIISFNTPIPGWNFYGIQMDDSKKRTYKLELKKNSL